MPRNPKTLPSIRDRIVELRRVKAANLRINPHNFRTHPQAQRDALTGPLREIGYADALIAYEDPEHGLTLIDGHLRVETTPDLEVPVLITDLSPAEASLLLATLDPLAAMAGAQAETLDALLHEVRTGEAAVQSLLATLADQAGLYPDPSRTTPTEPPEPQLDRAAELQSQWQTALGQLWEIPSLRTSGHSHRLLCGDSTEAAAVTQLMDGMPVDLVWTDPPYGVAYVGKTKDALTIQNDALDGDALAAFLEAAFQGAVAVCRPGAVWFVAAPAGPMLLPFATVLTRLQIWRQSLVWVKDAFVLGHSDYHYRHEHLFYGWTPGAAHHAPAERTHDTVWEIARPKRSAEHPTMKPIELITRALQHGSEAGATVLDLFAGSGSTLVAAEATSRVGYGLELDPKYVAVILQRLTEMGLTPHLVED